MNGVDCWLSCCKQQTPSHLSSYLSYVGLLYSDVFYEAD